MIYNFPAVRPKLSLDFVNSRRLDSRFVFTRSNATATRTNAAGLIETVAADTPRFDFDPVTLACRGLLVEEGRTNLLTYSAAFDNGAWTKDNCSATTGQSAPDGTTTGFTIAATTAGTLVRCVRQGYTTAVQGAYTFSVYVKLGTLASGGIALRVRDNAATNDFKANFDLFTLAVPTMSAVGGNWAAGVASVKNAGNGWYRLSITGTTNTSYTSLSAEIYVGSYTTYSETIGTVRIWGAQLEAGQCVTTHIPTSGSTATRGAESVLISGSAFTGLGITTEASLIATATPVTQTSFGNVLASMGDGTTGNRIQVNRLLSGYAQCYSSVGAVPQTWSPDGLASLAWGAERRTIGVGIKAGDLYAASAGAFSKATISPLPPFSQLRLGARFDGTQGFVNGPIEKVLVYNTRLTNEQLLYLTR